MPEIQAPDRRHRQDHQDHHLRHRPAYPQGRRADLRARAASSATRASASWKVGAGVTAFKPGDRVLISCIILLRQMRVLPARHVFPLHHRRLDPRQHDRRHPGRICAHPACRHQPLPFPQGADEEALVMLSDILPTGFECGVLNGKVSPAAPWRSSAPGRSVWRRC